MFWYSIHIVILSIVLAQAMKDYDYDYIDTYDAPDEEHAGEYDLKPIPNK